MQLSADGTARALHIDYRTGMAAPLLPCAASKCGKLTTKAFHFKHGAAAIFEKLEPSQHPAAVGGRTLNRRTQNYSITMETS
jgi:hypothetical protein